MMLTTEVVEMLNPLFVLLAIIAIIILWRAVETLSKCNSHCCRGNCCQGHRRCTCGEKP